MDTVFIICAVIGGTILVCQFVMTILGIGEDGAEIADDLPELGDGQTHYDSTWLFSVISFRTLVAALAFFGLAGWAALAAGQNTPTAFVIAVFSGLAAMFGVHYLMQLLYKLSADGTVRIERSVGKRGTVYIPIPGDHAGKGKVQINLQGRIVEYQAMTSEKEKLPTGAQVVVVGVLGPGTVDVELVPEVVETSGQ